MVLCRASRQAICTYALRVVFFALLEVVANVPESAVVGRIDVERCVVFPAQRIRLRRLALRKDGFVKRHLSFRIACESRGKALAGEAGRRLTCAQTAHNRASRNSNQPVPITPRRIHEVSIVIVTTESGGKSTTNLPSSTRAGCVCGVIASGTSKPLAALRSALCRICAEAVLAVTPRN